METGKNFAKPRFFGPNGWMGAFAILCIGVPSVAQATYYNLLNALRMTPNLTISDTVIYDFGTVSTSGSSDHIFYVTNNGTASATGLAAAAPGAPFYFKNGSGGGGGTYPGFGGTCGNTLAAGSSCTIAIIFIPTATAIQYYSSLEVSFFSGATQTVRVGMQGLGTTNAILKILDQDPQKYSLYGLPADPGVFNFGAQAVASMATQVFTVVNNGASGAVALAPTGSLSSPYSFTGGAFPGSGGTCGNSLSAGANCTVSVSFAPTGTGTFNGTLSLGYSDPGSPQVVSRPVVGSGTNGAVLTIYDYPTQAGNGVNTGASFDFGTVSTSAGIDHTFLVVNTGGNDATSVAPSGSMVAPFSFKNGFPGGTPGTSAPQVDGYNYCNNNLIPKGSVCAMTATFSPISAIAYNGTVSLYYADGLGGNVTSTRIVKGAGTAYALLSIKDASDRGPSLAYDYGPVQANSLNSAVFIVTNLGLNNAAVTPTAFATGFSWSNNGSFPGLLSAYSDRNGKSYAPCNTNITAGTSCAVSVDFRPSTSGNYTSAISLSYLDGSGGTVIANRGLKGSNPTTGNISIIDCMGNNCGGNASNTGHVFGTQPLSTPAVLYLFVTNSGSASANVGPNATGLTGSGDFVFANGSYPGGGGFYTNPNDSNSYLFCPTGVLPAGQTCVIAIKFNPSSNAYLTAILSLSLTGAQANTLNFNLAGTGSNQGIISITDCMGSNCSNHNQGPPAHNYGTQAQGSSTNAYFFVTNSGSANANITSNSITPSATFNYPLSTYPGGSGYYLNPGDNESYNFCSNSMILNSGQTCVIAIAFNPSGAGNYGASLLLNLSGASTSKITYNLSGITTSASLVSITDCIGNNCNNNGGSGKFHDFKVQSLSATTSANFFVTNSGTSNVSITSTNLTGSTYFTLPGGFPGGSGIYSDPNDGTTYNYCSSSTLYSGQTCVVSVNFSAGVAGAYLASLVLNLSGGSVSSLTYSLGGTATSLGVISLVDCIGNNCGGGNSNGPPGHNYGSKGAGGTYPSTFFVTNGGGATVNFSTATINPSSYFAFVGGSYPGGSGTYSDSNGNSFSYCGSSLNAGVTCAITVNFLPSGGFSNTYSALLSIPLTSGAYANQANYALSGTGVQNLAIVSLTDCVSNCNGGGNGGAPSKNFNTVAANGVAVNSLIYVRNDGSASATLSSGFFINSAFNYVGGTYPGTGGDCAGTLASGANCKIAVSFTPFNGVTNAYSGSFTINVSGGTAANATINLLGAATTQPFISIKNCVSNCGGSSNSLNFKVTAAGTTSPTGYLYVTNNGGANATLSVSGNGLSGPTAFSYPTGSFPGITVNYNGYSPCSTGTPLTPGSTCVVALIFSPPAAQISSLAGQLTITGGNTVSSVLNGAGTTQAIVSISDSQSSNQKFDYATAGTSIDYAFTIQNSGNNPATLSDGGTMSATSFGYSGGSFPNGTGMTNGVPNCGTSLAANSSCALVVRFNPSGNGPASGTLTVNLGGASSPKISRNLSGTATTRALLLFCDSADPFSCTNTTYNLNAGAGTTVTNNVILFNRGGQSVSLGAASLSSPTSCSAPTPNPVFNWAGFPGGAGPVTVNGTNMNYCTGGTVAPGTYCAVGIQYERCNTPAYPFNDGNINVPGTDSGGATTPATRTLHGY